MEVLSEGMSESVQLGVVKADDKMYFKANKRNSKLQTILNSKLQTILNSKLQTILINQDGVLKETQGCEVQ